MKKNIEKLIFDFRKVESELVAILSNKDVIFDLNESKPTVKKYLKDYIKKVNKAKKLFEQYESLAKKIENIDSDDEDLPELSKVVLEFREYAETEHNNLNGENKNDLKNNQKDNQKLKSKKDNNVQVKEL